MVITMVVIFSIFSFLLLPLGFVKNEFFPKVDTNILYVGIEYPPGTNVDIAKKESLAVLSELKGTVGVNFVSLDLGTTINFESGGAIAGSANNVLFSFNLKEEGKRPESFEIAEALRGKFKSYQKGKFSVIEQSGGPPVGADIQIKLLGDDLLILNQNADQAVRYLEKQAGTANVEKSVKSGTSKLVFVPDSPRLVENQISIDQLGALLRLYASGVNVEENKFPGNSESQDITLRLYNETSFIDSLNQINIPTPRGNVPLASLGKLELENNPTLITREAGKRTLSVSAAVRRGFDIQKINSDLVKYADSKLQIPEGYQWKTGELMKKIKNHSTQSLKQCYCLSC